jgi:hypothetical protein
MNTFKKKSLYAAVLAGLGALGAAETANAVHLNPDGLGQVLIYPYFTTRTASGAAYDTLLSVVNTTNQTKLVKVRFLEGRNSREVLDFNLYLSPADVFTGVITATAAGAQLVTNDNSCVTPSDLFSGTGSRAGLNTFKNFIYAADTPVDGGPDGLDRTREGYFEVIEMGVVTNTTITGYAKHGTNSVPANCAALDLYDPRQGLTTPAPLPGPAAAPYILAPSGGLSGRANVISAGTGANYAYDAVAFDGWSNVQQYSASGEITPALGQATPPVSNVFVGAGAVTGAGGVANAQTLITGNVNANWNNGWDAFSATIMRNSVLNEYVLDAGTASKTDWVLTYPTKNNYVFPSATNTAGLAPFSSNFTFPGGSCDPYAFTVFNREEAGPTAPRVGILPSPRPPGIQVAGSGTCWESTVVPFQGSSLLGSVNTSFPVAQFLTFVGSATSAAGAGASPGLPTTNGPNGWASFQFGAAVQRLTPLPGSTLNGAPLLGTGAHIGLPVISLAFTNFNKTGVISQYGQVSQGKYTRNIQ